MVTFHQGGAACGAAETHASHGYQNNDDGDVITNQQSDALAKMPPAKNRPTRHAASR